MAAKQSVNPNSDVFDPSEFIKVEDHTKEMGALSERIKELEDKLGSHEKIADTLSITAQKAVTMQTMLAETFVKLLSTNDLIKEKVTEIINKTDRNYMTLLFKRFGFVLYTIFVSGITAIVIALINKYIGS